MELGFSALNPGKFLRDFAKRVVSLVGPQALKDSVRLRQVYRSAKILPMGFALELEGECVESLVVNGTGDGIAFCDDTLTTGNFSIIRRGKSRFKRGIYGFLTFKGEVTYVEMGYILWWLNVFREMDLGLTVDDSMIALARNGEKFPEGPVVVATDLLINDDAMLNCDQNALCLTKKKDELGNSKFYFDLFDVSRKPFPAGILFLVRLNKRIPTTPVRKAKAP
ncbi:MAG: hypothetical protein WC797_02860 [Candidatus Paceibacterota bacterium]